MSNEKKQTAEEIEAILIKAVTSFDLSKQVFQIQQIINQQNQSLQRQVEELKEENKLLLKERNLIQKKWNELDERFDLHVSKTEKQLVEVTHKKAILQSDYTKLKEAADEMNHKLKNINATQNPYDIINEVLENYKQLTNPKTIIR